MAAHKKVQMYVAPAATSANEAKAAGNMKLYYELKMKAAKPKGGNHKFFERHLNRLVKEIANG